MPVFQGLFEVAHISIFEQLDEQLDRTTPTILPSAGHSEGALRAGRPQPAQIGSGGQRQSERE